MADYNDLFLRLSKSKFRANFKLKPRERAYLRVRGMQEVLGQGRKLITERLGPAEPKNDGRQTPMRNHPVFVAQHATGCCCRGCLAKWHGIPKGRELTGMEIDYITAVIAEWLKRQGVEEDRRFF